MTWIHLIYQEQSIYHFDVNNNDYYLNLNHDKWINRETKEESNQSFLDLYQEVITNASDIINKLYDYIYQDKDINTKKLIKNIDYGTGLPLSPNK